MTPEHAAALDKADVLRAFRGRFVITDPDIIYFDGNSLGRTPHSTRQRLRDLVDVEWADRLIRGWDSWITLAAETGDLLARSVLAAEPGEVVLSDSTTVNLYKLASAALDARPDRRALVCLSHVAYRSGAVADLTAITAIAHQSGALTLWDLSHSVGSVPVPLGPARADLAVGCTYKYLNGGPGAPAFLYVRRDLHNVIRQPIWGWFSQRDQFAMGDEYNPVESVERFLVGTPPVMGLVAAAEGVKLTAEAGIERVWAKGRALTEHAIELSDAWLTPLGFQLASPRDAHRRGAHICLRHPQAWQISQALRDVGVIADFRAPRRLRLGFAPLYTSFTEVYRGIARLRNLVTAGQHLRYPQTPGRVT